MKLIFGIILLFSFTDCRNDIYSDSEKTISSENGNTSVHYKNSYVNGVVNDSIAGYYFDQAQEFSARKNYNKAIEYFEKAEQKEPKNKFILNALGSIYTDMKIFNKSTEYYKKSLEMDSLYSITYLNYGFSKAHNDEFKKAIELYNKGIRLESSGEKRGYFYYNMSRTYYQMYEYEKAKKCIDKAIELVNDDYLKKEARNFRKLVYER